VATPTRAAPAREPQHGAGAGASPSNEAEAQREATAGSWRSNLHLQILRFSLECVSPGATPGIAAARRLHLRHGSRRCRGEHGAHGRPHSCRTAAATRPVAAGEVREDGWSGALLEGTAGGAEVGAGASEQRSPYACCWGSRPHKERSDQRRAALGRQQPLDGRRRSARARRRGWRGTIFNNCNTVILQSRASII